MNTPRNGENAELIKHRGSRFFKLHNYWFFATREGAAIGPFDTKEQACKGVNDFIEFASKANNSAMHFFSATAK